MKHARQYQFQTMKQFVYLCCFAWLLIDACTAKHTSTYTVATWNIRFDNPADGVNNWNAREENVLSLIKEIRPDILFVQEALENQVNDLSGQMKNYSWEGVGRDDGVSDGEFIPIFYNAIRYERMAGDHFWLSEQTYTPGSKGWDAACSRMVTWIMLKDRYSGEQVYAFNTHFDHVGEQARTESAMLIIRVIDSLCGNSPVILAGDFNCSDQSKPYQLLISKGFDDAFTKSQNTPIGPGYTFSGFDTTKPPGQRIDFIFTRNVSNVLSYKVLDKNDGRYYPSDHLPVAVTLDITSGTKKK